MKRTSKAEELGIDQERSTARTEAHAAKVRPRPKRHDDDVISAAIPRILPDIEEWASGEDVSDAAKVLRDALRWDTDAYRLAKAFDDAGWDVDERLVSALEVAHSAIHTAYADAVQDWLREGARPKLALGADVVFPAGQDAGTRGEITAISETRGTYTVFAPSLGHVREGLGTHGRIFTWEALESANDSASAPVSAVDPSRSTPKKQDAFHV